jgi:hypothetical protein
MRACSWRWGKGYLFSTAQHLEPAVLFCDAGLIGFGFLVHHFRVEEVTQPRFERCTLPLICGVGAEVLKLLWIGFKIEELRWRANIVDVLMPQIAQHVERVGPVGVELREHGPVLRWLSGEGQQRHAGQALLSNGMRRTDCIKDGRGDVAQRE